MNKEEFIMKYNDKFHEIKNLCFSDKDNYLYTTISDNPRDYKDMASQFKNLKYMLLEEVNNSEYYQSVTEFVQNCNDDVLISNGPVGEATKQEFLESEGVIKKIIDKIDPQWTKKQKAAFVHYEMGKIISYAPDYCFAGKYVGDKVANDTRNIWKSIDSGISVCNGITAIQRTILSRIGVNAQEISSRSHSFMLVETEEGNIITDATWDLTNTLFEARPLYFGKSYEELQQIDGPISKAHRLAEPPENVIRISEEELREIYHSIGLTTEKRKFKMPILEQVDKINSIHYSNDKEKVDALLKMFTENFSEQSMHLSETRTILENSMRTLGIDNNSITTKFVYAKNDEECEKPYLCIHLNGEEISGTIWVLNAAEKKVDNLTLQDFDASYKAHTEDTREPFWKKYMKREETKKEKETQRE